MIRGHLFDDHYVTLTDETAQYGGSWIPGSGDPLQAFGQGMIRLMYEQLVQRNAETFLDVGANTGSFCLLAGLIPALRVLALEPVKPVCDLLCTHIAANGLQDRVAGVQLALSDFIGHGFMTVPNDIKQAGLSFLDDREPDMPCTDCFTSVTTLDDYWPARHSWGKLDALKLDVEGIEARVLRGGEQTIRRDRPFILLEATNTRQTVPLLESWGYTIHDYQSDLLATKE